MAQGSYYPEHAQKVIEVAKSELQSLLKQQLLIATKVKQVRRTVKGLTAIFGMGVGTAEMQESDGQLPRDFAEGGITPNDGVGSRLERACRIALLESEEPANAAQVYDRIVRRGSYRLVRYKHPLLPIIRTLDLLERRGEVRALVEGDCKRWQWNSVLLITKDQTNRSACQSEGHVSA